VIFYFSTPEAEPIFKGRVENIRVLTSARHRGSGRMALLGRALRKIARVIGGDALCTCVIELTDFLIGLRLVRPLAEIIAAEDYDVVHINNTFTYQSASILAATMVHRPIVAYVQNPVQLTLLSRWLARRVQALIAINHQIERELAEDKIGCPVQTIYDSAEVESISAEQIARARTEFALEGWTLVGSVGRLELQKGYRGLISTASEVVSKNSTVRFVVIGEGTERDNLDLEIKAAGLQDNFVLSGFRKDVLSIVAALDVFVCSSEYEGGPIALIEAMLLERPVVTTDVGLAGEVITNDNGIVVRLGITLNWRRRCCISCL
jgi:glycosyltransferase involved in cell wall biosynthesis